MMLDILKDLLQSMSIEGVKMKIEYLYYIAGIVMCVGVFLAYKQYKAHQVELKAKHKRDAIERSLDYLKEFSDLYIPEMRAYKADLENSVSDDDSQKLTTIKKLKNGVTSILNKLEHYCIAIEHDVVDEETVFTPTSTIFCDFIHENKDVLEYCESKGIPYKNIRSVYGRWSELLNQLK